MNLQSSQWTVAVDARMPAGVPLDKKVEADGRVTYRCYAIDTTSGISTETVYDEQCRPVRILKRSTTGSQAEVHLDPETGRRRRLSEVSKAPDGSTVSREVAYLDDDRQSEIVTILTARGLLGKLIERHHTGPRTTYQGETTYDSEGNPSQSINQHMQPGSGALVHREQIYWVREGQRAMTEHFHFNEVGMLTRYVKVLHYLHAGPFSEETQDFHPERGHLVRRELVAYSPDGFQTCLDVLFYAEDGSVAERKSTFFDCLGRPIAIRAAGREIGNSLWP
ncbi:MAG TPA: hypothetical protein V6D08_02270 [Candidatus Obscuribacterales bacterium]